MAWPRYLAVVVDSIGFAYLLALNPLLALLSNIIVDYCVAVTSLVKPSLLVVRTRAFLEFLRIRPSRPLHFALLVRLRNYNLRF